MYIQNRKLSLAYKVVATLVCLWGLGLASDLAHGQFDTDLFFHYTHLTNILCLAYFILSAVYVGRTMRNDGSKGPATLLPRVKGAVVMAITVTMLIYWTLLHQPGHPDINMLESVLEHLIVPLLMIFDWLLFDPKGSCKKIDPVLWLAIPLLYYGYALIVAQTGKTFRGSRYPYFFIDSDLLGWGRVFLYVFALVLIFLVIGYLVYAADWFIGKGHKNKIP